ncbi:MAG: glycosyltransferase family 39 protein [Bacteroidetes bacterium]|nr:glycosyltransferase family 39 protein [Bacteroidota bacterium]
MVKWLNTDAKVYTFIALVAALLFIPFIGNIPLFDWDEINFAECAREMVVTDNYSEVQLYFQPFWEKPPLFIWLQAICMNLFGISEFSARLPDALCGVVTLLALYHCGKKLNDRRFGLIWAFVYACTLLPHLYFKSGIIDPWFNLFIFLSIYELIRHTNNPAGTHGYRTAALAGVFLGLALLTKGPAAVLITGLTVGIFFLLSRFRKMTSLKFVAVFALTFLVVGFSWFMTEALKGNTHIIREFIDYQVRLFKTEDSDHGGPFLYHFVVLLVGCFPSSLFLILAHKRSATDTPFQKHTKRWMLCLFWVVLLLFSIVKTKIVHYSSLCYFPLTYLAAYAVIKLYNREFAWKLWLKAGMITLTVLMGLAFVLVGCINYLKPILLKPGVIDDVFAVENLKADVHWGGWEWLIGVLFIAGILFSLRQVLKQKMQFVYGIFITSLVTVYLLICFITPKIEQYSQHAAIEFHKACARQGFYIETIGYKSYAYLFYGQVNNDYKKNADFAAFHARRARQIEEIGESVTRSFSKIMMEWMLSENIDKPACFATKVNYEKEIDEGYTQLTKLYRKNGYVFYIRMPGSKKNDH